VSRRRRSVAAAGGSCSAAPDRRLASRRPARGRFPFRAPGSDVDDAAEAALHAFDEKWGKRFPVITQAWLNAWEQVIPFMTFGAEAGA
jgi:hypothetical protein